jgi:signal transduction histidine kinase/ligand-binding sensor domain-containing protein
MLLRVLTIRVGAPFLFAAVLCAYLTAGNRVLAQGQTLSEMDHKSWTARDGAPQGVTALAQATDGVLWIGTEGGLFSFDGRTFSAFQPRPGEPDLPAGTVRTLLASRDGAIWIGFRHGGMARVSQGRVELFAQADQLRLNWVDHIRQSSDGGLWALHRQRNLIRFGADKTWHVEPTPLGDAGGAIYDIFIDSSDTLWLAQGGRLYRRPLNQSNYFATEAQADWLFGFAETPDHSLWVNDSITDAPGHPTGRTQHIDRTGKVLARLPYTDNVHGILFTPDGSLVMTPTGEGILRMSAQALADRALLVREVRDGVYAQKDGLSSTELRALLLDADGNLWTGGQRGLDRFRKARLVRVNLKHGYNDAILCAGPTGDVWIAAAGADDRDWLYKISGQSIRSFTEPGQLYSMSCGAGGDTLLLSNNGILNVHANRISSIRSIPGAHPFDTLVIVATSDHAMYASVSGRPELNGIWRYTGGWTKLTGARIPSSSASALYVDSRGRLLTGYNDGLVGLPLEDGGQILSSGDPGLGPVLAILETSQGVIAAGVNGMAALRDGRLEMLNFADRISSGGIGGLLESTNGDLWLNALHGVVHVPAAELQAALKNPQHPMKSELLTEGDFVGPIQSLAGKSIAARDAEGKLWFATLNGVFHIDPGQSDSRTRLPIVSIRAITVDQKPVSDDGVTVPGLKALEIQYLGVNLTSPEKVIYRYRLDGFDDAWQDAGHRTDAVYSRLPPGTYTFRVMASNGDGVWTEPISTAPLKALPLFYQTAWFRGLCVAAVLAMIWMFYQLRLQQLQRRHEALNQSRLEMAHVARLATLSVMTASITHEVSQPISGIVTNANTCARMLAADPPNVAGAAETVRRTIRDADRASEVIKRLRAMFAKKEPTIEMVDLNEAAREVIAMSSAELRKSGAVLQADFAEPLPAISGDRVQLQQVILNLLLNAADSMAGIEDRPKTLQLQTEIHGSDCVKLLVRDCGVGLDPRSLEKLFEAFYTTKAHGLGIGLAVSRSIIESHKGQLWAMINDGPGATFGFTIPRSY